MYRGLRGRAKQCEKTASAERHSGVRAGREEGLSGLFTESSGICERRRQDYNRVVYRGQTKMLSVSVQKGVVKVLVGCAGDPIHGEGRCKE